MIELLYNFSAVLLPNWVRRRIERSSEALTGLCCVAQWLKEEEEATRTNWNLTKDKTIWPGSKRRKMSRRRKKKMKKMNSCCCRFAGVKMLAPDEVVLLPLALQLLPI